MRGRGGVALKRRTLETLGRLTIVVIPTYFLWELLQAPGFVLPENRPVPVVICALATIGDAVLVIGVYYLGALVFRNRYWFVPPRLRRYAMITAAALALQLIAETVAVNTLRIWTYSGLQPTLPVLGTGLFAVLQPIVLIPLCFYVLAWWEHARRAPVSTVDRR